jgi:hypothetical protein
MQLELEVAREFSYIDRGYVYKQQSANYSACQHCGAVSRQNTKPVVTQFPSQRDCSSTLQDAA